jgi:Tol biopolymer transport system component
MIAIGIFAILMAAFLATRSNTAPLPTTPTVIALQPTAAQTFSVTSTPPPTPNHTRTSTPTPTAAGTRVPFAPMSLPRTATPIAALQNSGALLFDCEPGICLLNADGTNLRQIAPSAPDHLFASPEWAPDGGAFAGLYISQSDAKPRTASDEVILFSADGKESATFAPGPSHLLGWTHLTWSPNGRWLAFVTYLDRDANGFPSLADPPEIWILDRANWKPAFAPFEGNLVEWSSDSRRLAFATTPNPSELETTEVWVFDTQQAEARRIAPGSGPAWLPNSTRLVFVSADGQALQAMDLESGRTQTLLTKQTVQALLARDHPWLPSGKLYFAWPTLSPDVASTAFRVWGKWDEPWPKYFPRRIFTINADGTNLRRWPGTDTPNTAVQIWSPQGNRLGYTYFLEGNGSCYFKSSPDQRFRYKDCCPGLILADVKRGMGVDEPGPHGMDWASFGAWSPDGEWFVASNRVPPPGEVLIFNTHNPVQHWEFPGLFFEAVQWQPQPR